MDALTISQAAALVFAALFTAIAALVLMSARKAAPSTVLADAQAPEIVFLFDGDNLVDASAAAYRLLSVTVAANNDMSRLVNFLAPRFPDLHDTVMACNELDAAELLSSDGRSRLVLGVGGGRLRLRLEDVGNNAEPGPDRNTLYALTEELAIHRQIAMALPVPSWRQTVEGRITWTNRAYRDLAILAQSGADGPPKLFDLVGPSALATKHAHRVQLDIPENDTPHWYDCNAVAIGSDCLFTAVPADGIVKAEATLRDFVHTLTQTFAHLSVGLAIFDKSRRLTLFNPALTDLLGLSAEFLISHPSLIQVLDQLREQRMMPEPKNYKTWRHQMSALEAAAADGVYSETWTLSDGRTYRVSGRPHPGGAVAFLFEDISAEISLTRRFRAELETSQAIIDSLDEAIAVFSPAGHLMISNRGYADLWDVGPTTALNDISFLDASRRWQKFCPPTPVWGDARDFVATISERSNWTADVRLNDGRLLNCRFEAMPRGATLVAFSEKRASLYLPVMSELAPARA